MYDGLLLVRCFAFGINFTENPTLPIETYFAVAIEIPEVEGNLTIQITREYLIL
jgi:hypothetical protein